MILTIGEVRKIVKEVLVEIWRSKEDKRENPPKRMDKDWGADRSAIAGVKSDKQSNKKVPIDYAGTESEGGVLGKYVFADNRDPMDAEEKNTQFEDEIARILNKHYTGKHDELDTIVDKLYDLQQDYPAWFAPPKSYRRAYRTMTVPVSAFRKLVGRDPTEQDMDGEVHGEDNPGIKLGAFRGRRSFSWALNPETIHGLVSEWDSLFNTQWVKSKSGNAGFVFMFGAPLSGGKFIMNPFKMVKTRIPWKYAYQTEVISIDDIAIDKVSWFYFDENTNPEMESTKVMDAIHMVEP